jgi:hypothetical protein
MGETLWGAVTTQEVAAAGTSITWTSTQAVLQHPRSALGGGMKPPRFGTRSL